MSLTNDTKKDALQKLVEAIVMLCTDGIKEDLLKKLADAVRTVVAELLRTSTDPGATFVSHRIHEIKKVAYPILYNERYLQTKLHQNRVSVFLHLRTEYWKWVERACYYVTPTAGIVPNEVANLIMVITTLAATTSNTTIILLLPLLLLLLLLP